MLGTALYYPHIDIRETGWLRSAMLFWDEIQTIVPSAIEEPYKELETALCAEEGFLRPLHCDLHEEVLSDLGSRVLRMLGEPDWTDSATRELSGPTSHALMHAEKLSHEMMCRLEDAVVMHSAKMPPEIKALLAGPLGMQMLSKRKVHPRLRRMLENIYGHRIHPAKLSNELGGLFDRYGDDEWLLVDRRFAEIYMSALAALLAKEVDVSPLTNEVSSSGVNLRCLGDDVTSSSPSAARGALVSVVMEGLRIDPEAPIKRILEFRRKRKDQLAALSGKFDELKKSIQSSAEGPDIEANAKRVFENSIRPELGKFKDELKRDTIESSWSGFQVASTFSAVPSTALWATGFEAPVVLGVGAFITAAGIGVKSYLARSKVRSASPYTYLLDVERKFSIP
ncbi:MAG: DUF6236 family protein [Alphaproteobacteria bacterium]